MPATSSARRPPDSADPSPLHQRAMDNLEFIRETMARATTVTAISGAGIVAAGLVALGAALLTRALEPSPRWATIWVASAIVAFPLSFGASMRKARALHAPLLDGSQRRLVLSFFPPMIVGACLTVGLWRADSFSLLPAVWLLSFGAGVATGGAFSVRAVPIMGIACMLLGALALLVPPAMGTAMMAIGFGVLQLGFGAYISRRHGG
jgi:hypothetical protein